MAESDGPTIRLLAQDREMLASMTSPAGFELCYRVRIRPHEFELVRGPIEQFLDFQARVRAVPPWICYLTIAKLDGADLVVGCCGYKGNPSMDGTVEIAYYTLPEREGRGFATAAARELIEIARAEGTIGTVLAHTLPERNASCRILEKLGFEQAGTVYDPEDGTIWKWRLQV